MEQYQIVFVNGQISEENFAGIELDRDFLPGISHREWINGKGYVHVHVATRDLVGPVTKWKEWLDTWPGFKLARVGEVSDSITIGSETKPSLDWRELITAYRDVVRAARREPMSSAMFRALSRVNELSGFEPLQMSDHPVIQARDEYATAIAEDTRDRRFLKFLERAFLREFAPRDINKSSEATASSHAGSLEKWADHVVTAAHVAFKRIEHVRKVGFPDEDEG
jgi:hypothetical protein